MAGAILLFLHIFAGSVALLGALVALVAAKGRRYRILLGRVYAIAVDMTVILPPTLTGHDRRRDGLAGDT